MPLGPRPRIVYTDGWKYRLEGDYSVMLPPQFAPGHDRTLDGYVLLRADGLLTLKAGYCWDGASGPAVDTPNFLRGSLVHDALYQLIGVGMLPLEAREYADHLLVTICAEDGMWAPRRWWVLKAVHYFGPHRGSRYKVPKVAPPEELG